MNPTRTLQCSREKLSFLFVTDWQSLPDPTLPQLNLDDFVSAELGGVEDVWY